MSDKSYAVICHDLSPTLGSEAGNAWRYVCELERQGIQADVFCATTNQLFTENYKAAVAEYRRQNGEFRFVRIQFVPQLRIAHAASSVIRAVAGGSVVGFPALYSLFYRGWLRQVSFALETRSYAVVHLFNHISFRWPLERLDSKTKYLWGPVSGTETIAPAFLRRLPLSTRASIIFRRLAVTANRNSKSVRAFAKHCARIYAVTDSDVRFFRQYSSNVLQCLDVFASPAEFTQRILGIGQDLRLVAVGRLDVLKGLELAVTAVSAFPAVHLDVYGSGAELEPLRRTVRELSATNVHFLGAIPRRELLETLKSYHALMHPSLKEAGGSAVVEALETGLPVITHQAFGMAFSIDGSNGWPLKYESPDVTVAEIRRVLAEILSSPCIVERKSRCAYDSAKRFLPVVLADSVRELIRACPDDGPPRRSKDGLLQSVSRCDT
jgi:glycosyltransferase involved in cell wall biosynthesis